MTEIVQFALLGLGAGAIYALLAEGIVLIFRGSGVLNLAHGAFAMLAAYLFNVLSVNHGWALLPAMVVCIAVVTAIGVTTDQLLLRRLRRASPLSRLIATMGVLLLIQAIAAVFWGGEPVFVPPIITAGTVKIAGASVSADRLWLVGIAAGVTALLMLVWRFTRAGWVTEAVSESPRGAAALGWSPELVSASTWAAGAALAALAGILISPITQLDVTNLTLIVIAGLAAALIGGFRSFPLTLAGGLIVGIAQSEAGNYVHVFGIAEALPFLIIVVVLSVKGSSLPLRGYVFDRLPAVGRGHSDPRVFIPALVCGCVVIALISSKPWLAAINGTFAVAIVLLSLVVLTGYAGQVSLAQYALAGIGAIIAARLVSSAGFTFPVAALVGILGAMVIGLLFSLPALRTRGVNLAVVTLGLGLAIQQVVFDNVTFTGSVDGTNVGSPHIFGWSVDPQLHPARYAMLCVVAFAIAALAVANLRRGRSGRRLLAVRANERAAAAVGINVFSAKSYAFCIAGALAGLGGVLIGFSSSLVTFDQFDPISSITAVASAVIGGIGYLVGPIVGATVAPQSIGSVLALSWQNVVEYLPILAAVLLLYTLIDAPDGAVPTLTRRVRKLIRRPARPPAAPPEVSAQTVAKRVAPKQMSVRDLTVRYGGVVAAERLSFDVEPGRILSLIGPNGAGKTSVMDAITGFTPCSGSIRVDGEQIDDLSSYRRARAGVGRSFQGLELFSDMTVLENLQAASDARDHRALVTDLVHPGRTVLPQAAVAAVHEFGLVDVLDRLPDELPYGKRRLVAIARTVAMEPSVLLLDEPVAGLDDDESAEFARLVRRLADSWGMAILVIEHDMDFIMGISDHIIVIDFGRYVADGTPAEIQANEAAIAAYLGESVGDGAEAQAGLVS